MPYLILMWKKQLWGLSFQLYNVFVRMELQKITVSLNIVQANLLAPASKAVEIFGSNVLLSGCLTENKEEECGIL